jgi:hypothetical protein
MITFKIIDIQTELPYISPTRKQCLINHYHQRGGVITWDADGRVTDFKVMIRPLKAINLVHRMMGEMLQKLK